jgi:hypothetical protein
MSSVYAIKAEVADWSQRVLEAACDEFAGLPPCPFARGAWIDGKVTVEVVDCFDQVVLDADAFDPESDAVWVYALIDSGGMTVDQFDNAIELLNAHHGGVWVMGSHHHAPANELMPDFEATTDVDYGLVLVQSLKHLVVASDKLRDSGYYDGFNSDEMAYIERRKEQYNAWNEERHEEDRHNGREEDERREA